MNIRDFLIEARDNDRWKDLDKNSLYDIGLLALEYYFDTSELIIPDNYYIKFGENANAIMKKYKFRCLPLEFLLLFDFYKDIDGYGSYGYHKLIIMNKIKEKETVIQDVDLWRKVAFLDVIDKNNKFEILDLLLEKGYVSIFFSDLFDYDKYEKNQYVDNVYDMENLPKIKDFNFNFYEYPKNNIDKIEKAIRSGVRIKKVDFAPSELLYDDRILSALVDTGQIDSMVEDNRYDNIKNYSLKKTKIDKTLKLHRFVPLIIKNLEEVNYDYKDFDINRMKNFVIDEDFELISNAYLKYKEDIKNIRFIPEEENKKDEDKNIEELNGRDLIINMLNEGIVTEDDLLEIIVDYRRTDNKVKKLKKS